MSMTNTGKGRSMQIMRPLTADFLFCNPMRAKEYLHPVETLAGKYARVADESIKSFEEKADD